eukprot:27127-Eustigmatos_ZCMA.PRE.1
MVGMLIFTGDTAFTACHAEPHTRWIRDCLSCDHTRFVGIQTKRGHQHGDHRYIRWVTEPTVGNSTTWPSLVQHTNKTTLPHQQPTSSPPPTF